MTSNRIKTPIADAFRKWEKSATKEELEQFCRDTNAFASVSGILNKNSNENEDMNAIAAYLQISKIISASIADRKVGIISSYT